MQPDGALTPLSRAPATLEWRRSGRNGHNERHGHADAADCPGQGGDYVFHGRVGATVVLEDGGGVMAINVSERSARRRLKLLQLASIARPGCHANVAHDGLGGTRQYIHVARLVERFTSSGTRCTEHPCPGPFSTLGSTPSAASGWLS